MVLFQIVHFSSQSMSAYANLNSDLLHMLRQAVCIAIWSERRITTQVSCCLLTASGSSQAIGWEVDLAARELPNLPPTDNPGEPPEVARRPE